MPVRSTRSTCCAAAGPAPAAAAGSMSWAASCCCCCTFAPAIPGPWPAAFCPAAVTGCSLSTSPAPCLMTPPAPPAAAGAAASWASSPAATAAGTACRSPLGTLAGGLTGGLSGPAATPSTPGCPGWSSSSAASALRLCSWCCLSSSASAISSSLEAGLAGLRLSRPLLLGVRCGSLTGPACREDVHGQAVHVHYRAQSDTHTACCRCPHRVLPLPTRQASEHVHCMQAVHVWGRTVPK
jgi:hypothetical protein